MISLLRGRIVSQEENRIILDVNGVGYELQLSGAALNKTKDSSDSVALHTHMHIKDNGIDLYGFASLDEKRLFQRIITVSGTGCKTALNILLAMTAGEFVTAILGENRAALTRISGIGKKTAERLILELRDPLNEAYKDVDLGISELSLSNGGVIQDALSALLALGYTWTEAETMISQARSQLPDIDDLQVLLKFALSLAGRSESS